MIVALRRDGAIIFGDLIGKLDVLHVHCPKCSRAGRYRVQHLIERRGRNAKLIDWLDEITADCPKKRASNMNHRRPVTITGSLEFVLTIVFFTMMTTLVGASSNASASK